MRQYDICEIHVLAPWFKYSLWWILEKITYEAEPQLQMLDVILTLRTLTIFQLYFNVVDTLQQWTLLQRINNLFQCSFIQSNSLDWIILTISFHLTTFFQWIRYEVSTTLLRLFRRNLWQNPQKTQFQVPLVNNNIPNNPNTLSTESASKQRMSLGVVESFWLETHPSPREVNA